MMFAIDKCFSCYYSCMKRMPVDAPCCECKYAEYKKDQRRTFLKSKYKKHPAIRLLNKIHNNITGMVLRSKIKVNLVSVDKNNDTP